MSGSIRHVENLGADCFLHVAIDGLAAPLIARTSGARAASFRIGATVHLTPDAANVLLFDAAGNRIVASPMPERVRTLG